MPAAPIDAPGLVHHLPIATTLLAVAFVAVLLRRARLREWPPHLLWWAAGIVAYGLGTALESTITLRGNSPALIPTRGKNATNSHAESASSPSTMRAFHPKRDRS